MSGDWYYMKRRWIGGTQKVGPLSDPELLAQISHGKVAPDTLVMSTKTKHKWVTMASVGPAIQHWQELHPEAEQTHTKAS